MNRIKLFENFNEETEKKEWWDKNHKTLYDAIEGFGYDEWVAFAGKKEASIIQQQNRRTQATILLDMLSIEELDILINDYKESIE